MTMNNMITVKKDVLYLGGKVNEVTTKDGNKIQYVSMAVLVKDDKCKLECSCKIKVEDFIQKDLQEYESYKATFQFEISEKIKVRILNIE